MRLPSLHAIARAYLMSIAFWCSLALLMGLQYRHFNRNHPWLWLGDLVLEFGLRGLAFAFWTPPIFYLVGKYVDLSTHRLRYVFLWGLGAAPFVVLQITLMWVLVPPYDTDLQRFVPRTFQQWTDMIRGGFAEQIMIYIGIVIAGHAYHYLNRLRRQERERYEYQQALAASELQALKMQLHPHFLFNTLHGIATLIDSDARNAKAMIIKLSNLLRKALDRNTSDLIPLEEELTFVREYLDLEKMRLGPRLQVDWQISPETSALLVPQMILQPLAENAIRHGIASSREAGWLKILARAEKGILTIQLRNSVGAKTHNGTGVGLRNAEARLKYLYSGDASLRLDFSDDRTATVVLTLPALNSQQPADTRTNPKENPVCEFSSSTTNH